MKFFVGIDDSGRGPVIGPLVMAAVLANKNQIKKLKEIGVKDSKKLSKKSRERLASEIKKIAQNYKIVKISASEIDEKADKKINLNIIEAYIASLLINALVKNLDRVTVIVDCPSANIKRWKGLLLEYVKEKEKVNLRCEHKADSNYVIVGAASIIAKVSRDKEIERIKRIFDVEFGSGYPSDPLCQEFLKTRKAKELAKKGLIRKSWITWQREEKRTKQKKLTEF